MRKTEKQQNSDTTKHDATRYDAMLQSKIVADDLC